MRRSRWKRIVAALVLIVVLLWIVIGVWLAMAAR
jgi:hypothetical protein